MGSRFKHRNRKPEYGWVSSEVDKLQKKQNDDNRKLQMFFELVGRMKEMTLYICHEEFGYKRDRLISLDIRIDWLCEQFNSRAGERELAEYCEKNLGINPKDVVKKIPFQYKQQLINELLPKYLVRVNLKDNIRIMTECLEMYFTYCLVALECKKHRKDGKIYRMTSNQKIQLFVDKIVLYCDILTKPDKYMLTPKDFQNELKNNCRIEVRRVSFDDFRTDDRKVI